MYVISSSSSSDGLGGLSSAVYRYEGLKVDVSGRGMLGFAKTTVTDMQTWIATETSYSQEFPHTGMVLRNATSLRSKILSELVNVHDSYTTASESAHFPHVTSSTEKTYEYPGGTANLVSTSNVTSHYDPGGEGFWGNVSRITVTNSGAGESYVKDTINHYKPADPVHWFMVVSRSRASLPLNMMHRQGY